MYKSIHRVREGSGYSEEFGVKVVVHQPATLHYCAICFIHGVLHRLSLCSAVCR